MAKFLMLGNEAVARGAFEAGATVAAAYPGTPSTEIAENLAAYDNIYAEWSPNEKVALEVAIGASIAGARSICSMKHVGLNVAADPLFTASYTGVNGGLVIAVADDPGMHSSQNEQDSRLYAKAAKAPMLEPADSQECKDYTVKAFEISEKFDCPVILRLTTRISHSRSIVEIFDKKPFILKDYVKNVQKYVMVPSMARKRHIEVEKRILLLQEYAETAELNSIEWKSRDIGIIASGIAYQYAKEAFADASFLKLGMIFPMPRKMIEEFAAGVKKLYVVEELEPYIEEHVKTLGIRAEGKKYLPNIGELSSSLIKERILGIKSLGSQKQIPHIPDRPPVMCPGCPHRGIFYVLKRLKLIVSGDIGCYTLGALPPLESMDTCICMGASVSAAHGMEKARGKDFVKKLVAVIGDSTFIHSGITPLIDIVYNQGNSTVIILDNLTTGMTGHQHNPCTGFNLKNELAPTINLEKLAASIGIERVRVVDPFEISECEEAIKAEINADQPSVIISRRACALLKNKKADAEAKKYFIEKERCKNCRMCLGLGCPAIVSQENFPIINASICAGCGLCAKLCKFGAITEKPV